MIIECDKCNAKFKIDDAKIPDKGARVKCKKCQHVFKVEKPKADTPLEDTVRVQSVSPTIPEEKTKSVEENIETPGTHDFAGSDKSESASEMKKDGFWDDDTSKEEIEEHELSSSPSFDEELKETFLGKKDEGLGEVLERNEKREDGFEMGFKIPEEVEKDVERESRQDENDFVKESIAEEESFPDETFEVGKKTSSSRRPLLLAMILIIVVVLGLYMAKGTQLSSFLQGFKSKNVATKARGALGLTGLKGYYVVNKNEGRVFIIEGKLVNPWNFPITSNGVKGSVFDGNGIKIDEKFVFPNIIFSRQQLIELSPLDLEKTLSQTKDVNLDPGASLPFMVVFSNVPGNLSEFEAEVSE